MSFTKHIKTNYKLTIFLLGLTSVLHAQNETPDSLSQRLTDFYNLKCQAELREYQQTNKYKWLNLVPSISYDWVTQRFYMTLSLTSLIAQANASQSRKQKQESIRQSNELQKENAQVRLNSKYSQLSSLVRQLKIEQEIYQKNQLLFQLKEKEYQNNEITVEEFTREEIKMLEFEKNLLTLKDRIHNTIAQIEDLTNTTINHEKFIE